MYQKFFITFFLIIFLIGCGKKENLNVKPPDENEAYKIYEEALKAMNNGEFFFAAKKFSEAENILPLVEQSAKAKLMNGFCFYRIWHEFWRWKFPPPSPRTPTSSCWKRHGGGAC